MTASADQPTWEERSGGVLLPVRAQPGARRNELRGMDGGVLKVAVTQVAEKGKANTALIALLAKTLGLRKSQVELISGETSRDKTLFVAKITRGDLFRRIQEACGDA